MFWVATAPEPARTHAQRLATQGLEDVTGYQYEPWHFRYVGRAGAELERRFFGIQQVFLSHYRHLMPSLQAAVAAGVNAGAGG